MPLMTTCAENCIFIEIFCYEKMPAMAPATGNQLGLPG